MIYKIAAINKIQMFDSKATKNTTIIKEDFIKEYRLKIGDTIREIREKRGYSQDELAEIMKINRSTISKIENGKFSCSIDYLSRFSWFLKFDLKVTEKIEKVENE